MSEREDEEIEQDEAAADDESEADGGEENAPSIEQLEAEAIAAAAAAEAAGHAKGRDALQTMAREAREAQERYLRTYADFENYRKRMQRDLADFRMFANEQLAQELLPVLDHLGLAIQHAAESGEANQGLLTGVQLVHKQFSDVLEKFGIKMFKAEGEPFDPAKHDAMMQVETADVPANTVVQVFQAGYLYHDKVLRHAKVGVSKLPAAAAAVEKHADEADGPAEGSAPEEDGQQQQDD
jgi:molecular chaperone GrpE